VLVELSDYFSDANTSTYAVPERCAPPFYPTGLPPATAPLSFYQAGDGSPAPGYGGGGPVIDDSGVYSALPGTPPPWNDDDDRAMLIADASAALALPEFPRERLRFVEKLGEGLFGEVHIFSLFVKTSYIQQEETTGMSSYNVED